ncbi:MAG: ATP-binding protein [Bacteroidales bacterium]|nr:ATP-binding protein [Bacteroidales bacterium]
MRYIRREIIGLVSRKIKPGKVIIINGARRVGKTVLLKEIIKGLKEPYMFLNGEDFNTLDLFSNRSAENYRQITGSKKILIIDEAQKIPEIGMVLKLMTDELPHLRIIVTGSSAFDLKNITGEPLTGRKESFTLFPLSEKEFSQNESIVEKKNRLTERLIYGNYPELIHLGDRDDKKDYLNELVSSYLLKDILVFENIRHSSKIFNLLRLIAFQTGSLVSFNELAKQLSISKNTVEKYLDLLTKVYILHKVEGFSRNLRKEITKNSKWYFCDNGIRNSVIANFSSVNLRNDTGQLWENYIISERLKYQHYRRKNANNFFWRTYDQQEIDWIEEKEGSLSGFEFKWSSEKVKTPATWKNTYPDAEFKIITPNNYSDWLS